MTDKPKRKNDEPIPRRYWWIFGTLAIVLLIALKYPVRIMSYWWIPNPILYGFITLMCSITFIRFIQNHNWKHRIGLIMLVCTVLSGWQVVWSLDNVDMARNYTRHCEVKTTGIVREYDCYVPVCGAWTVDYVTIGNLPVAIQTDHHKHPGFVWYDCENS